MKACIGIPSWFPDKEPARTERQERINRLFKQIEELWPTLDILVIAQNWQAFRPKRTVNKKIIKRYPELGILQARKTLHDEFLNLDYDYIIMMDDDCIIRCTSESAAADYLSELEKHPQGFCFIHGQNSKYHPYIGAQLNLCAISRYIYEKEQMVDIDPQKNEGYEDSIYACLLHWKYSKYEFNPPEGIRPIQFQNMQEKVPSTWADTKRPFYLITSNTNRIQEYIMSNKEFPKDYKYMIEKEYKPPEHIADGRKGYYLYF